MTVRDDVFFASTQWNLIERAGHGDAGAQNALAARYRPAIVRFFQGQGVPEADAENLAQETFLRFLTRPILRGADPSRGRFRTLLIGVAKNILREEWKRRGRWKRGADASAVSLEQAPGLEPSVEPDLDGAFDRAWARHLLALALPRLKGEAAKNAPPYGRALELFLDGRSQAEIAEALGTDIQNVKNYLRRARERLTELIGQEIAAYCADPAEWRAEAAHLHRYLAE